MKIEREKFLNNLETVKAGLSPREFIEQSSCFVFQNGKVATFNDEIACQKDIGINITGAVQANSLLDILGKIRDEYLRVSVNENKELEFRGKRKRFGITMDAEIFLPIDKVEVPEKWRTLSAEFCEAVKLVQHCVSTDESRFMMTCLHLHPEYLEACDNLQAMRCRFDTGIKRSMLVRGTSLGAILELGMDKLAVTKSWLHFRNPDGLVYSCRRYEDEYPSLDKIIAFSGHPIVIPKGVAEASDRAAVFAIDKSGDPLINVSLSNGVIRIVGEGLTGWYKEVKKVAYSGPPLRFLIAPELLKHISKEYSEAEIGEKRLKVKGGSWEYVTVLGQKKAEEKEPEEAGKKKGPAKREQPEE